MRGRSVLAWTHSCTWPPAGFIESARAQQKNTISGKNNCPDAPIRGEMEKGGRNSERPSINQRRGKKRRRPRGKGGGVSSGRGNKTIANGKVARRYLKYAMSSGFVTKRLKVCAAASVFCGRRACLEAYLEQSSPAPPPCTPTILREFSADSAALWGRGGERDTGQSIT